MVGKLTFTVEGEKIGEINNYQPKKINELERAEIRKLMATANKRIDRLEKNNLQSSPAYQKWLADGEVRFSVKGKTHNELQKEVSRLKRFLESETSTVRGVNRTLKEMARNTGIKYKNLKDLRSKSAKFFELASKVEQYLRTVDDIASAIGYQKIWEAINKYVKDKQGTLDGGSGDIDQMVKTVTDMLKATNLDKSKGDSGDWWYID
jgi:predicted RNase H-like nuclease (RuvC/YqgF family)